VTLTKIHQSWQIQCTSVDRNLVVGRANEFSTQGFVNLVAGENLAFAFILHSHKRARQTKLNLSLEAGSSMRRVSSLSKLYRRVFDRSRQEGLETVPTWARPRITRSIDLFGKDSGNIKNLSAVIAEPCAPGVVSNGPRATLVSPRGAWALQRPRDMRIKHRRADPNLFERDPRCCHSSICGILIYRCREQICRAGSSPTKPAPGRY
jgi:hypothetical protein